MSDGSQNDEISGGHNEVPVGAGSAPVTGTGVSLKQNLRSGVGRLSELSTGVLASLVAGALLLMVTGSAAGISLVNRIRNDSTQVVTGQAVAARDIDSPTVAPVPSRPRVTPTLSSADSPAVTAQDPPAPAAAAISVKYDPDEHSTVPIYVNDFAYFFDHRLYITIGNLVGDTTMIDRVTIQEGALAPCVFENVDGGRFVVRRSEREYEVTFDKTDVRFTKVRVNVGEFIGRQLADVPCARLAT